MGGCFVDWSASLYAIRFWSTRRSADTLDVGSVLRSSPMPDILTNLTGIDERIAILRENLRELVEQAAPYSGAADEELTSRRIAEQEAQLELLTKQRDER
jgi:hypothetical protein